MDRAHSETQFNFPFLSAAWNDTENLCCDFRIGTVEILENLQIFYNYLQKYIILYYFFSIVMIYGHENAKKCLKERSTLSKDIGNNFNIMVNICSNLPIITTLLSDNRPWKSKSQRKVKNLININIHSIPQRKQSKKESNVGKENAELHENEP